MKSLRSPGALSRRRLILQTAAAFTALVVPGCRQNHDFSCTSVVGLTPQEIQVRARLAYVDRSPDLAKNCANCNQFLLPPEAGKCGACKIMKGPVHPLGHCTSYVPRL